jgi:hypothetical protein
MEFLQRMLLVQGHLLDTYRGCYQSLQCKLWQAKLKGTLVKSHLGGNTWCSWRMLLSDAALRLQGQRVWRLTAW